DLESNRARVFGIQVDRAAFQSGIHDRGVAEALLMPDLSFSCACRRLRDDLAEYVGFGETLRADVHRLRVAQQRHERDEQPTFHTRTVTSSQRCARMNVSTYGSAGSRTRSSKLPICTTLPSRIITITSAKKAASAISCVTMMTVLRRLLNIIFSSPCSSYRVTGSSAPSGSSSRMRGGSSINARI